MVRHRLRGCSLNGDRAKYRAFVGQLAICFGADSAKFSHDKVKISYAATFLRGPAFEWLKPYINELSGGVTFASYADFLNGLKAGFGDPDEYATAERELETLTQQTSCSSYYSQFVGLISQLGWKEDAVKIHYFRQGLKDNIKDQLIGRFLPDTTEEFPALCINLDNQIRARLQERKNTKPRNFDTQRQTSLIPQSPKSPFVPQSVQLTQPASLRPAPSPQQGEPMDLDAASRKAYRRANNLCTYCSAAGHWVKNCPKAKARNNRSATMSFGSEISHNLSTEETKNVQG